MDRVVVDSTVIACAFDSLEDLAEKMIPRSAFKKACFELPPSAVLLYNQSMESIVRNVQELESAERQVYEGILGEHLQDSQRVLIMVLNAGVEPDETIRGKVMEDFHQLCKQGTKHRERLGVSVKEADQIVDEAIQHARSKQPE